MKYTLALLTLATGLFFSCNQTDKNEDNALSEALENEADVLAANNRFETGDASTGEEYFTGVLAGVIRVDVRFRSIDQLDKTGAKTKAIQQELDSTLYFIDAGRKALNHYTNKTWPKRAEMHDLTLEWYQVIENIVNNHLKPLAEPMGKPDEEWTPSEVEQYENYTLALDDYYAIDKKWVDFQDEYIEANNITITGTVNEERMVNGSPNNQ